MKIIKEHVRDADIEYSKEILAGQWCGFATTELFVLLSNDPYVLFVCHSFKYDFHDYLEFVIDVAKKEITNSSNWPEWVG